MRMVPMKVYQHVLTRLLVQMTSSFVAMARNAFLNHRDVTEMMIVETTQTNQIPFAPLLV